MEKLYQRIFSGFIPKLKNQEFAEVCQRIIHTTTVEELDEESKLAECFRELKSYEEDIRLIKKLRNPHPLTVELRKRAKDRKDVLLAMRHVVLASMRSLSVAERDSARLLLQWITNNFGGNLYKSSQTSQSNSVRNLLHEYSCRTSIQEAVSIIQLSPYLDSIEDLTEEIDNMLDVRTREQVADAKKAAQVRKVVYEVLKKFFAAAEVEAATEAVGMDVYEEYRRRLNNILDYYRTPLNARATRYKNAALKAEEEDDLGTDDDSDKDGGDTNQEEGDSEATRAYSAMRMWNEGGEDVSLNGGNMSNEANGAATGNGGGENALLGMANGSQDNSSRELNNARLKDVE